jgi:hypothetical protein
MTSHRTASLITCMASLAGGTLTTFGAPPAAPVSKPQPAAATPAGAAPKPVDPGQGQAVAPSGQTAPGIVNPGQTNTDLPVGRADLSNVNPGAAPSGLVNPGRVRVSGIARPSLSATAVDPGRAQVSQVNPGGVNGRLVNPGQRDARVTDPGITPAGQVSPGQWAGNVVHPGMAAAGTVDPGNRGLPTRGGETTNFVVGTGNTPRAASSVERSAVLRDRLNHTNVVLGTRLEAVRRLPVEEQNAALYEMIDQLTSQTADGGNASRSVPRYWSPSLSDSSPPKDGSSWVAGTALSKSSEK